MIKAVVSVLCFAFAGAYGAVEWRNLDEANHLGGRKASTGYLKGKVVLVDRWGAKCPPCRKKLPRLEEIWNSFKSKPFVVLGGHCNGWGSADEVKAIIKEKNITFPIYQDAGLSVNEPIFNAIPFLYVVDATGKLLYKGHDDLKATEVLVTALTDLEHPRDIVQYKHFLDFELENLPGRAYLRMKDFKKRFPEAAKEYEAKFNELKKIPNIVKLSEFIEFAKKAKDLKAFSPKKERSQKIKLKRMIESALSRFASLKESENPLVVQETKNAIADLMWTKAEL